MNDEKEDCDYADGTYKSVSTSIGDIWFDPSQSSYVINTGNSNSVISASSFGNVTFTEPNALEITSGKIKFGSLVMEVEQFETCLRHLLEITKREKPEEFI